MRLKLIVLVATICIVAGASGVHSADAKTVDEGQKPKPTGTSASGTPAVAVLLDGGGNTIATYKRTASSGATGGGGGATWKCWYYEPTTPIGSALPGIDRSHVATVEVGKSYWLWCDDADNNQTYVALITWDPQNPFGTIAAGDRAADEARNAVVLIDPDIQTSPPPGRPQLVGLPTWLWVDAAWKPHSAAATLGGVTATVTATPSTIVWSAGDGSAAFTCTGPGEIYDEHHPDRVSHCAHTYLDRSTATNANGTFALTATITYTVHWQATNGEAGDLDPVTRTRTIPMLVREAQALIG